ncbi:MAG: hypothetical protein M3Z64_01960 [Verrucomicrobiota bacterium]|nr:hypothetical protein [Verrucomicrobiota bacterium]
MFTPTWSRDAALFALTAVDPARPNQLTLNAFTVNPANGAILNVTNFEDKKIPDGSYSFTYALYKAFSPDRGRMAVNSYIRSGGGAPGPTPPPGGAAPTTTPILQIFPTNGDPGPLATVHVGPFRDEIHHDGEGVDWSPTQNILATPVKIDTPLQSGGGRGETTALFLAEPVTNAGNARQLTFPHTDQVATPTSGYVYGEHDFQPRFSPNGASVAYVRSFQIAYTTNGGVPSPDVQALRVIDLTSGADRQVVQFQQGLYISGLDWSPDGTQLVFDLGQQASSGGVPIQGVQPGTDAIYLVNTDGSSFRQLLGAVSSTPAWKPPFTAAPIIFGNVSTRGFVGTGDNVLIGGFIITGNQAKKVLIRGMGPSLGAAGVQGTLPDPFLELHQGSSIIATNDNWQQAANPNEIPNGFAPSDAREAVIVTTLQPGAYTPILKGAHDESGVAIVEAYDLTPSASAKLGNISTRGFVGTGDNAMFGGFIVTGGSANVMVRALGPSLQSAGVPNTLQDPTLDLYDGNGVLTRSNDDWQQAANANEIPNGFAPSDPREAVIVATLAAGNHSAIVRGKGGTGIAIVEAYNLQ